MQQQCIVFVLCVLLFVSVNVSEILVNCTKNPCQGHGVCDNGPVDYTCNCFKRYTGQNCSIGRLIMKRSSANTVSANEVFLKRKLKNYVLMISSSALY